MHLKRRVNPKGDRQDPISEASAGLLSEDLYACATEDELCDRCNIWLRKAAFRICFETKGGAILDEFGVRTEVFVSNSNCINRFRKLSRALIFFKLEIQRSKTDMRKLGQT